MSGKVVEERSSVLSIIKKFVIEFFILVFVMGFFSKSVVNYFLPKVTYEPVIAARVEKTVDIEGFVESNEVFKVRLGSNAIVDEYMVKKGDYIKKGEPLFRINDKYGISSFSEVVENTKIKLEKEKLNLDRLATKLNNEDIELISLKEKIDVQKKEFTNTKKLYESGAIPLAKLEKEEQILRQLELELESGEKRLEEDNKELYIQLKDSQNNIKKLQDELEKMKSRQEFYSEVENDGIYYSDIEGAILELNTTDIVINGDDVVAEIGKFEDFSSIKFTGYVPLNDEDMIELGNKIEIQLDGMNDTIEAKISRVSGVVENGNIRIDGVFKKDTQGKLKLGKKYKGKIKDDVKADHVISKASIIPNGELKSCSEGMVYLLDVKDGVLGKEYIASEVKVKIIEVGDEMVAISGLESYKQPKVINNLSYKIKDGVKVFLWE